MNDTFSDKKWSLTLKSDSKANMLSMNTGNPYIDSYSNLGFNEFKR